MAYSGTLLRCFLFVALLSAAPVQANHHQKQQLRGAIPSAAYNKQGETTVEAAMTASAVAAPDPVHTVPLPPMPLSTEDANGDIPIGEMVGGAADDGMMHLDAAIGEHSTTSFDPCPANQCSYNCNYDDEGNYSCFCGLCA